MSKLVQGETLLLRSGKSTAIHASVNPRKYAPPSPKNILPLGQLTKKNPATEPAMIRQVNANGISPTCLAMMPKAAKMISAVPAVSPFNPSIMLMELATPPTAMAVKTTEMMVKLSR